MYKLFQLLKKEILSITQIGKVMPRKLVSNFIIILLTVRKFVFEIFYKFLSLDILRYLQTLKYRKPVIKIIYIFLFNVQICCN